MVGAAQYDAWGQVFPISVLCVIAWSGLSFGIRLGVFPGTLLDNSVSKSIRVTSRLPQLDPRASGEDLLPVP